MHQTSFITKGDNTKLSKTRCIFKTQRCKKCENLILKSEKHECSKPPIPHSRRLDLEIGLAFDDLNKTSLRPRDITKYLKKRFPERDYDKFDIKWHMKRMYNRFTVDDTISQNKYAEKYYCIINSENPTKPQKIKTEPIYLINPPRTQWGLVHVIKKITISGEEKTLAMVYGKELAELLLEQCKKVQA